MLVTMRLAELVERNFPTCSQHALASPILFGDFKDAMAMLTDGGDGEMRLYEDVGDYASIKPLFEEILGLYNKNRKAMTLVRALEGLPSFAASHQPSDLASLFLSLSLSSSCLTHLLPTPRARRCSSRTPWST